MTGSILRRLGAGCLLVAVSLAAGCVFTIPTDPKLYPVAADKVPALPAGAKVELVNGFSRSYMARMEGNQQADLQEFTQTAITLATGALEQKGVAVGAGGKPVVLEVTGPTWTPGFGMTRGSVSLDATLGATKVSTWGEAAGINATKNFSSAISEAVENLLQKAEFRDYLATP